MKTEPGESESEAESSFAAESLVSAERVSLGRAEAVGDLALGSSVKGALEPVASDLGRVTEACVRLDV